MFYPDHALVFSYMYRHAHTHWYPCTDGFSYMAAWGCSIGFKNSHNICKALWLIILALQRNHAIRAWAMAEHEPYGKERDDEASALLMKEHTQTHSFSKIRLYYLYTNILGPYIHSLTHNSSLKRSLKTTTWILHSGSILVFVTFHLISEMNLVSGSHCLNYLISRRLWYEK